MFKDGGVVILVSAAKRTVAIFLAGFAGVDEELGLKSFVDAAILLLFGGVTPSSTPRFDDAASGGQVESEEEPSVSKGVQEEEEEVTADLVRGRIPKEP